MAGSQGPPPFGEAVCLHCAGRLEQAQGTWGQHRVSFWYPSQHTQQCPLRWSSISECLQQQRRNGEQVPWPGKAVWPQHQEALRQLRSDRRKAVPSECQESLVRWKAQTNPAAPSIARRTMQSGLTGLACLFTSHSSASSWERAVPKGIRGWVGVWVPPPLQSFRNLVRPGLRHPPLHVQQGNGYFGNLPSCCLLPAPHVTLLQHPQVTTCNGARPETGTVLSCKPEQAGPTVGHPSMCQEYMLWSKQGTCVKTGAPGWNWSRY